MMKRREESNGFNLVIGGTGLNHINAALSRMGFTLLIGADPRRCLQQITDGQPHGIILTDNMIADSARPDGLSGEQRLIALLEQIEQLQPGGDLKVWLFLTKPVAEPWKTFSRFDIVHEIRRGTNPLFFAGELLTHLRVNQPVAG